MNHPTPNAMFPNKSMNMSWQQHSPALNSIGQISRCHNLVPRVSEDIKDALTGSALFFTGNQTRGGAKQSPNLIQLGTILSTRESSHDN
jgi:hypothetical protein